MAANQSVLIHKYLLTIGSSVLLNSIFHEIPGILISQKLIQGGCLDNLNRLVPDVH